MDVIRLRQSLSMTQQQFSALLGVSQAAVSQFESGRRHPSGAVHEFYRRLDEANRADVVVEPMGRRFTTMPATRWTRVIDPARVTRFTLPVRLDWSPRAAGSWDYRDEVHRRDLYRLLLDVGGAVDVMTFIDVDELAEWSADLLVSRNARNVLDRLVERTTVGVGA